MTATTIRTAEATATGFAKSEDAQLSRSSGVQPFERATINLYPSAEDTNYIGSLPQLVEFNAEKNPDHVFCIQSRKQAGKTSISLLHINHSQLKDAISRCANWLRSNIPGLQLPSLQDDGSVKKGPPVALFMESDIGLLFHQLALLSLGVPVRTLLWCVCSRLIMNRFYFFPTD